MRLLLDTHAFLWAYARPAELSATARRALQDPENDRIVSIASLWEIAIKASIGRLLAPNDLTRAIEDLAGILLPVAMAHVIRVRGLPLHHRDPFDRMLIAQAIEEGLTLVTRDRHYRAYGVPLLAA